MEQSVRVLVSNVVFDLSSDSEPLSKKEIDYLQFLLSSQFENKVFEFPQSDDIDAELADRISDLTGWCVASLDYSIC